MLVVIKLLLLMIVLFMALLVLTVEQSILLLPVFLAFLSFSVFYFSLKTKNGGVPLFDVGFFHVGIIIVATTLPILGYILLGMQFGIESGFRLYKLNPDPTEVGWVMWQCNLYLWSFMAAYYFFRKKKNIINSNQYDNSTTPQLDVLIGIYVLIFAFIFTISIKYGLYSGSYADTYLNVYRIPLFLRQLTAHFSSMLVNVLLLLLVYFFTNYRKYKWWIIFVIIFQMTYTLYQLGSRTEGVLVLLTAIFMYHYFVKNLPMNKILTASFLLLFMILAFGTIRAAYTSNSTAEFGAQQLSSSNEFMVLFGTAVEVNLARKNRSMPYVPPSLHISEFMALIPQQLVPFKKETYADWYLENFHPETKEAGGAYAFGVIAQSTLGVGWLELVFRGLLFGMLMGLFHSWCYKRQRNYWVIALYLWVLLHSYYSFRVSTFNMLPQFLFQALFVFIVITMANAFAHKAKKLMVASRSDVF